MNTTKRIWVVAVLSAGAGAGSMHAWHETRAAAEESPPRWILTEARALTNASDPGPALVRMDPQTGEAQVLAVIPSGDHTYARGWVGISTSKDWERGYMEGALSAAERKLEETREAYTKAEMADPTSEATKTARKAYEDTQERLEYLRKRAEKLR